MGSVSANVRSSPSSASRSRSDGVRLRAAMITAGADITSVYHAATTLRFYNGHVRTRHTPTVVLLDLDDTLFDHEQSARQALRHVHDAGAAFAAWPFEAFEAAHAAVLEELHLDVLAGRRTVDQAREERFRRLLVEAGASAGEGVVRHNGRVVPAGVPAARRPVSGAVELLAPSSRVPASGSSRITSSRSNRGRSRSAASRVISTSSPYRKR